MNIRPASSSDAAALAAIEAVCFPAAEAAGPQAIAQRLAVFPDRFLVAEEASGSSTGAPPGSPASPTICMRTPGCTGPTAPGRRCSGWTPCPSTAAAGWPLP